MVRLSLAGLLVGLVAATLSASARELTPAEARQLVLEALRDQGTPAESPNLFLSQQRESPRWAGFPGFYTFEAELRTHTRIEALGYYSVDRKTAEVWESMVSCHRVEARPVKVLQKSLRKKIGLSRAELRRLSSTPFCSASPQRPWIRLTIESVNRTSDGFDVRVRVKNDGKALSPCQFEVSEAEEEPSDGSAGYGPRPDRREK